MINTLGRTWANRSRTPLTPKSGLVLVNTAPKPLAASMATSAGIPLGVQAATWSPGPTPTDTSHCWQSATCAFNCCQVSSRRRPVSSREIDGDRRSAGALTARQQVLGVATRASRKEPGGAHVVGVADQCRPAAPLAHHAAEPPCGVPEPLRLCDRPLVQRDGVCAVRRRIQAEGRHRQSGDGVLRWLPQQGALLRHRYRPVSESLWRSPATAWTSLSLMRM